MKIMAALVLLFAASSALRADDAGTSRDQPRKVHGAPMSKQCAAVQTACANQPNKYDCFDDLLDGKSVEGVRADPDDVRACRAQRDLARGSKKGWDCHQIQWACEDAGFLRRGPKGKDRWNDCMALVQQGRSVSGVEIVPDWVQNCWPPQPPTN
jgi:hypothetical protein